MCNAPILAHPMFDRPFILYTDASADAFAAVLCQVWERDYYIQGEAPTLMSNSNTEWEQSKGIEEKKEQGIGRQGMWKTM